MHYQVAFRPDCNMIKDEMRGESAVAGNTQIGSERTEQGTTTMSELLPAGQFGNAAPSGTTVGKFLANRGIIIIKEIRDVGTLKCEHGAKLHAETLILSTAKSSTKIAEKTFGIRLERIMDGETEDRATLDFDEAEEFCNAVQFMVEAAQKIATGRTDYIEVCFSTKDSIQVGFYQTTDREQQAFIKLGDRAESTFLEVDSLPSFKKLVEAARSHLLQKGAPQ